MKSYFFGTCEVHVHSIVGLTSYLHIAGIHQPGEFGGVAGGGGELPYMGYIGVCHCEGYGF